MQYPEIGLWRDLRDKIKPGQPRTAAFTSEATGLDCGRGAGTEAQRLVATCLENV